MSHQSSYRRHSVHRARTCTGCRHLVRQDPQLNLKCRKPSFNFSSINPMSACAPGNFVWTYKGPQNMTISLEISSVNDTGTQHSKTIAQDVSAKIESFIWRNVSGHAGSYIAIARMKSQNITSSPFLIEDPSQCPTTSVSIPSTVGNTNVFPTSHIMQTSSPVGGLNVDASTAKVAIALGSTGCVFLAIIITTLFCLRRRRKSSGLRGNIQSVPVYVKGEKYPHVLQIRRNTICDDVPENVITVPTLSKSSGSKRKAKPGRVGDQSNHSSITSSIYYYAENNTLFDVPVTPPAAKAAATVEHPHTSFRVPITPPAAVVTVPRT